MPWNHYTRNAPTLRSPPKRPHYNLSDLTRLDDGKRRQTESRRSPRKSPSVAPQEVPQAHSVPASSISSTTQAEVWRPKDSEMIVATNSHSHVLSQLNDNSHVATHPAYVYRGKSTSTYSRVKRSLAIPNLITSARGPETRLPPPDLWKFSQFTHHSQPSAPVTLPLSLSQPSGLPGSPPSAPKRPLMTWSTNVTESGPSNPWFSSAQVACTRKRMQIPESNRGPGVKLPRARLEPATPLSAPASPPGLSRSLSRLELAEDTLLEGEYRYPFSGWSPEQVQQRQEHFLCYLENLRQKNPHAPRMLSLFNPLRKEVPSFAWNRTTRKAQGPKFKTPLTNHVRSRW